jgi:hypothetical protein
MLKRIYLLALTILLSFSAVSQVTETYYQGTLVVEGYALNKSYGPFELGFNFEYFGNTFSQFYVSSNGLIAFGAGSTSRLNSPIPTAATPNNFIAAFWDSLQVDDYGSIMYSTVGAAPARKCIIQFRNIGFSPFPVFMGSFQVILTESTNKIHVQYRLIVDNYSERNRGGGATIGIENIDGTAGLQYAYRDKEAVETDKAISYTPNGLGSYTLNENEEYEWVFLVKDISLPEPGITKLVSPAHEAIVGSDVTLEWQAASNASSYTLLVSNNHDLTDATVYAPGAALTYDVTGLSLDTTYYWGVFANSSAGTSWCEIKRFHTSSTPPLAGVPKSLWIEEGTERIAKIQYTGGDGSPVSATITTLPTKGKLYQVNSGVRGVEIVSFPSAVTDTDLQVIYMADGGTGNDAGSFNFFVTDGSGSSPEVKYTINVNPPGVPNVLLAARSTSVEVQLDRPMNDPSGQASQFAVTVDGSPVVVTAAALKEGDPYTIILTLASPLSGGEAVFVFYTKEGVTATTGALLETFVDEPAELLAQTITFPVIPPKKLTDPDHFPGASASGGGLISYSSSDLQVATIVANRIHYTGIGSAKITARQPGDATYAPARYERPLTVSKGDNTITFNELPIKTYGDAPFGLTATSSSGLAVTFASDNPDVASVAGSTVTINMAGSAVITASQAGDALWDPAPDVQRTLIVNKAEATLTLSGQTTTYTGVPQQVIATTSPAGLAVNITYDGAGAPSDAGLYAVVATIADDNYLGSTTGTFEVAKASLTATADDKTRVYGAANPQLTFTYSGFVNSEGSSVIDAEPVAATTADATTGVGTVPITLSGGNDNNYDFTYINGVLTITPLDQTIGFGALVTKQYDHPPFELTATASSGLPVSFASSNEAVATISGSTVTITGVGSTVITASQPGNENYNPAAPVNRTLIVDKADQVITFNPLPIADYGDGDLAIEAQSTSGLPVTFTSSNPAVATITGNVIHITGGGFTTITASQAGNSFYNATEQVSQIFNVNKVTLTITAADKTIPYLEAIPTLTFTVTGFVRGETISVIDVMPAAQTTAIQSSDVGTYPITFSGGEDNSYSFNYTPAILTITKIDQVISFINLQSSLLLNGLLTLSASSTSGLEVLFESLNPSIASVSVNSLTGLVIGTAQIRAYTSSHQTTTGLMICGRFPI